MSCNRTKSSDNFIDKEYECFPSFLSEVLVWASTYVDNTELSPLDHFQYILEKRKSWVVNKNSSLIGKTYIIISRFD